MRSCAARSTFFVIVLFMLASTSLPVLAAQSGSASITNLPKDDAPLDEDGYWGLVQRSRDVVTNLKGLSEQEIKQALSGLADEWEAVREIRTDDGQLIPVDHGYLLARLRADRPGLGKITDILDALLAAHEEYPGKIFSTADLASLHTILSRPEFFWPEKAPNPINAWFQRMWERFNKWLNSILGNGTITIKVNPDLLPVAASILLTIILLLVFRTLLSDFVKEARVASDKNGDDEPLTSEAAFERAQSLSRGGDLRSAVRYLYLSSLLMLDERGLLRYDRTRTNREYLRSLSNSPGLVKPLGEVIEVFDEVWYGYHSLEEQSFRHYSDRVKELKENQG